MRATRPVKSAGLIGTWDAREVVSIVATRRFVSERMQDLKACGMTIVRIILKKVSPRALAASTWPGGMVFIPVIRYSEQKAEGIRTVAIKTQVKYEKMMFR